MEKILRKALFYCLFLYSFSVLGQTTVQEYLNLEAIRIQKADSIEVEINEFIINNMNSYNLTQTLIDEIMQSLITDDHEGTNHIVTQSELQDLFLEYKKEELRKLFFLQNPTKLEFFTAIELPVALQLTCINGSFEQNTNASYTFSSQIVNTPSWLPFGCNVIVNANNFVPPIGLNNFQLRATRVDQGNEPLLSTLNPPILINRVPPNGGNFSLKINPTPVNPPGLPGNDGEIGNITSVRSSNFIIDENTIEFNFLLIGKIVPQNNHPQPTFRYMLVDANTNQILRNVCITMNANDCRFLTTADTRPGWANPAFGLINYTPQWVCERINTANLMNRNVSLIFQVSDCQRRGHFATVYIDNLCGINCNPTWGSININPINIDCPTTPFQVCGNFQLPDINTNIGNITLNIINQVGIQVGATIINPIITGQNFCFTVNPNVFGLNPVGNFTFQVNSTLINVTGCINQNVLTDTLGTVSFNNCCLPNAFLAAPTDNVTNIFPLAVRNLERSDFIRASNIIGIGDNVIQNGVVYHAGNFVDLIPGFDAITGSQFAAYPQGCTNPQSFVYRQANPNSDNSEIEETQEINLVKIYKELIIYPNPSNSFIDLIIKNDIFNKIIIVGIDGKIILDKTIEPSTSFNLDISRYASGIYIVNVISNDGRQYSQKLIKN